MSRIFRLEKNMILLVWVLFICNTGSALEPNYRNEIGGLRFFSQERSVNERTSINLFDTYKYISDSFVLKFDFRLYDPDKFGYIFKIFNKEGSEENAFLHFICNPEELSNGKKLILYFNKNQQVAKLTIPDDRREWYQFEVTINLISKTLKLTFKDSVKIFKINLPDKIRVKVIFGQCGAPNLDVAAIDLRNISFNISHSDNYFWPLNENSGNYAHEIFYNQVAIIENPCWLANSHFYWKKIYEGSFDQMCGVDFDPIHQNLLMVNRDSMCTLNVLNNELKTIHYSKKRPFENAQHFTIFNPKKDEIISYDFHFFRTNGKKSYAIFNPLTSSWTIPEPVPDHIDNYHFAMFWNPDTTKLVQFGGYAHYRYFKDFKQFDFKTNTWENLILKGDSIFPRTHSCVGRNFSTNEYYLFGGLGNEEGDQALGPRNYYDLYQFNLEKKTLKKVWEFQNKGRSFISRANMVINPLDSTFYALCGNSDKEESYIKLYKFSLKNPGFEIVSDSIPVVFANLAGNAYLYYNNKLKELYCVVRQTFRNKETSVVSIYKINFPPSKGFQATTKSSYPLYTGLSIIIMFLVPTLIILYNRKQKKKKYQILKNNTNFNKNIIPTESTTNLSDESVENPEPASHYSRPINNAIWFIGKFKVYNKKGQDITYLFSNKVKNIFYILYFKSFYGKGISSDELSDMLWPGMDKIRIKNNRGVTFNHLRKIFEDLDCISISNEDNMWRIVTDNDIYIDIVDLYQKMKNSSENIDSLIGLYANGSLLQGEKFQEIDGFKSQFENHSISLLTKFCADFFARRNFFKVIEITDIIHQHFDPFNEDALLLKIKALTYMRQHKKALQEYHKFTQRFTQIMNAKFEISFNDIIEGINSDGSIA